MPRLGVNAMSYHRRYHHHDLGATQAPNPKAAVTAAQLAAQGKTFAQSIGEAVGPIVDMASKLVSDPALPEVSCMVGQLWSIENGKPVVPCPSMVRSTRRGGIGLREAVPAMRAWVFAKQNPWVKPVAAAAVLGVPFLLGFLFGRKS